MARAYDLRFDASGLTRALDRVTQFQDAPQRVRERVLGTLKRRLRAEAARAVSDLQLEANPRALAPYISVGTGGPKDAPYVSLFGSKERLPINIFKPRVSKKDGVRVRIYKGADEQHWPHAFKRGNKITQRIPGDGPSGLVLRLPITDRLGPSIGRVLGPVRDRGVLKAAFANRDLVADRLSQFARRLVVDETARLLKVL